MSADLERIYRVIEAVCRELCEPTDFTPGAWVRFADRLRALLPKEETLEEAAEAVLECQTESISLRNCRQVRGDAMDRLAAALGRRQKEGA